MSQSAAIGTKRVGWGQAAVGGLRFLATDPIGLLGLVWALTAFCVRPVMIAAHDGAAGPLFEAIRNAMDLRVLAKSTASTEWFSFIGCIGLAALVHMRSMHQAQAAGISNRVAFLIGAGYAALMAVAYVVFLWQPASVFTLITHDSFIFFDATYRISHGLRPSVDFPTALGAASLYLPAFAAWLGGGYAGSVELASVMVALLLCLACAQVGASRFPTVVTAILIGLIFLLTVPGALPEQYGSESQTIIDGDGENLYDNLTYSMFYNRWGWAALIPVFGWLAPRRNAGVPGPAVAPSVVEIAAFGAVLAFLFYLKPTYLIVGVAAAGVYALLNARPVRTLLIGAGVLLGLVLGIGLITGNLFAYVHDLIQVAQVSGGRTNELMPLVRRNLLDMLLSATSLAILAAAKKLTWRDVLVGAFIIAGCLFVINQNGQYRNMSPLIALAAYGVARVSGEVSSDRMTRFAAIGAFLMLAAAPLLDRGMLLIDQAYAIRREQLRPPSDWAGIPALKGVYVPERESFFGNASKDMTPEQRRKDIWTFGMLGRREMLRQGEYMETLLAGMADLRGVLKPGDSIATLDITNPFPFLMNARAPEGAWLTMHRNRTISEKVHPAPDVLFADTDHVMIAKMSMVQATPNMMMRVYGPWLTAHYEQRVETAFWTRWSRRKPPVG